MTQLRAVAMAAFFLGIGMAGQPFAPQRRPARAGVVAAARDRARSALVAADRLPLRLSERAADLLSCSTARSIPAPASSASGLGGLAASSLGGARHPQQVAVLGTVVGIQALLPLIAPRGGRAPRTQCLDERLRVVRPHQRLPDQEARAPAGASLDTSEASRMPLSLIAKTPRRHLRQKMLADGRSVSSVRRFRLLMPTRLAPAASARRSSVSSWTSASTSTSKLGLVHCTRATRRHPFRRRSTARSPHRRRPIARLDSAST